MTQRFPGNEVFHYNMTARRLLLPTQLVYVMYTVRTTACYYRYHHVNAKAQNVFESQNGLWGRLNFVDIGRFMTTASYTKSEYSVRITVEIVI